jgi:hypothetical protein
MAYLRAYQAKGDPFLGGLIKGIGRVIGSVTGLSRPGIGMQLPKMLPAIGRTVGKFPGGKKGALIAGGALGAGALAGGMAGMMHGGKHYRRTNVGNVKALRRAMRRVQGFAKLANSTMTFTRHHRIKKRKR